MLNFLSPIDAISSAVLMALIIFGLVELLIALYYRNYLNKRHLIVLRVNPEKLKDGIDTFIKTIKPPFTFEIAIHHLGQEVNYYLILARKKVRSLKSMEGITEVDDYHLFHHGGEHLGAYLKGGDAFPTINLDSVDFSKVNEVGEGVAIQLVFGRRRSKEAAVNFRILVSAPSSYQAKEIMMAIKSSFPGFNMVESRAEDFISRVNFREFSDKEEVLWKLT